MRVLAALFLAFLALPALAQDQQGGYLYGPEACGFEVTLPSAPHIVRVCDKRQSKDCYDRVQYTKVFSLEASLRAEIICNPVGNDVRAAYSTDVMKATLRAMTDQDVVQKIEMTAREADDYKQASLIGEGKQGRHNTLYIAQLWIDDISALSVELESIGAADEQADIMMRDILNSIVKKDVKTDNQTTEDAAE